MFYRLDWWLPQIWELPILQQGYIDRCPFILVGYPRHIISQKYHFYSVGILIWCPFSLIGYPRCMHSSPFSLSCCQALSYILTYNTLLKYPLYPTTLCLLYYSPSFLLLFISIFPTILHLPYQSPSSSPFPLPPLNPATYTKALYTTS